MIENNNEVQNSENNSYDVYSKIMDENNNEEKNQNVVEDYTSTRSSFVLVTVVFSVVLIICCVFYYLFFLYDYPTSKKSKELTSNELNVDLSKLTVNNSNIKTYELADYNSFINDYKANTLPDVYVTKFIFDGVDTYKALDIDDFIKEGNEVEQKTLEATVLNITASVKLTGKLKGMLAVNTNKIDNDISIVLNGVSIDTDSKKIPAIFVYNKDTNYSEHKVTIKTLDSTTNNIEGGKFKKTSLIPIEELSNYINNYSGEFNRYYQEYTKYYGVYTKDQIDDILFARVIADDEDLIEGDPYYFYKASGTISSDIDLYFEGKGILNVTSKNKEGIEVKGNLAFIGGDGEYNISSKDDGLNTASIRTPSSPARNDIFINVKSLTSIVSLDASEGDAIDSNGKVTIEGGKIIALSKPGQDDGIDSTDGTYINGGTIISTGDMNVGAESSSKQRTVVLTFKENVNENELITMLDSNNNVVFSYLTDRSYKELLYSSPVLKDDSYALYKGGEIDGTSINGFYESVNSFKNGEQLGYYPVRNTPQTKISYNESGNINSIFKIEEMVNYFSNITNYIK